AIEPGSTVTVRSATQPGHGSATINADGTVTYTPASGFTGSDSFTYTIADTTGGSSTGTVTIQVTPAVQANHPPVANNDSYATTRDTVLTVAAPGVLGNDTDADGDHLTATIVSSPAHGAVQLGA